jgi:hypothetical protein
VSRHLTGSAIDLSNELWNWPKWAGIHDVAAGLP